MCSHKINNTLWSNQYQCTLQYFIIGHYVTFKQVHIILYQLSHLKTLVLRNCMMNKIDEIMILFPYVKANTYFIFLTFKDGRLEKKDLKSFLSIK